MRLSAPTASVCGATGKANVAPTCRQRRKAQVQNAENPRRGGKNPPVWEEPASHLASRRKPASCQMPQIGQKPIPTSYERRIYDKGQTIQHSNLSTRFRDNPPKSGSGAHEPERLCDRVLSRKTDCDSERAERGLWQQKAIGNNLNQLTVLANMGKVQFANLDSAVQEFSRINTSLREMQEGGVAKSQSSIS